VQSETTCPIVSFLNRRINRRQQYLNALAHVLETTDQAECVVALEDADKEYLAGRVKDSIEFVGDGVPCFVHVTYDRLMQSSPFSTLTDVGKPFGRRASI